MRSCGSSLPSPVAGPTRRPQARVTPVARGVGGWPRSRAAVVSRVAAAASAALAQPVVNFVLIPELDFKLRGKDGFLDHLERRLQHKQHAVVVVAEGAGQHLFEAAESTTDASGNVQHKDIGVYLKEVIGEHFKKAQIPVTVKYIDPSYIIRSAAANSGDSVFCSSLAYHAVHGALSGKTQFVVGKVNNRFCYLPISEVVQKRRKIDLEGEFWFSVLQSTGQPFTMG